MGSFPTRIGYPQALAILREVAVQHRLGTERMAIKRVDGRLLAQDLIAPIDLPANVPIGWYTATVYLFSGGVLLAKTTQDFSILKGGFEQTITDLAHRQPALYGLATVIVACFTGWLAGVAFRKDLVRKGFSRGDCWSCFSRAGTRPSAPDRHARPTASRR